jgi:hypothetical protein
MLSLNANNYGFDNTATGFSSLANNSASQNTAYGSQSLAANTTGTHNTASGYQSLNANVTGIDNTANGYISLSVNTASQNTAYGSQSLSANTTGTGNNADGVYSLAVNTSGNYNTACGLASLYANSTGNYNTTFGWRSLTNATADQNTAYGAQSLNQNTTGGYNTANGYSSLFTNTTGNNNTAYGYAADVTSGNLTNANAFGFEATCNASNKVVIGNSSVTSIGGYAAWSNLSDGRFKSQIVENVPGLEFILKLRPVTYHFDARKFEHFLGRPDSLIENNAEGYDMAEGIIRTGFIAQEVEKAAQDAGYDFDGVHKPQNEKDNYSLAYGEFTVPLVKAVQEQQFVIERLKQEVELLKAKNKELAAKNDENKAQADKVLDLNLRLETIEAKLNDKNKGFTIK